MTLSLDQLDKLETIAKAATPGPWEFKCSTWMDGIIWIPSIENRLFLRIGGTSKDERVTKPLANENTSHIAAFNPETALELLRLAKVGIEYEQKKNGL